MTTTMLAVILSAVAVTNFGVDTVHQQFASYCDISLPEGHSRLSPEPQKLRRPDRVTERKTERQSED
jgi:hypothetical protein